MEKTLSVRRWVNGRVFKFVHGHNLVYNTCWEDPRLDREAMRLGPADNVLVITSAGCNALDYVLDEPNHVYAVDLNPRQNALLDLKIAGIRQLDFEDFFAMFGQGHKRDVRRLYEDKLRVELTDWSRRYWDRWIRFFDMPRRSFYFRGTSGGFARMMNAYIDRIVKLRPKIEQILEAKSIEEQRSIYETEIRDQFWTRSLRFAMGRDTTLSLVGVPRAQREQVEKEYAGGIVKFVQDCLDAVFAQLPIADNYFWRVYMTSQYSRECCPEYLKPENFERLKNGLIERISFHTNSVQAFLENHHGSISRFVLLDHMDWLSSHYFPLLESEWKAILGKAAPDARVLWRSGGLHTEFVDRVQVQVNGTQRELGELLRYDRDLAARLHPRDRVHTYGSFYIADLAA